MKKNHERDEAQRVLKSIKNRSGELAAYERELNRLIDEERMRRERKEDEEWLRKEKAREEFLRDVFVDREKKVKMHKN